MTANISGQVVEVVMKPVAVPPATVSGQVVEVVMKPVAVASKTKVGKQVVEVILATPPPRTRVGKQVTEVILATPPPKTRVGKQVAEVILKPLPAKQRKGNITIIQTEDIMREPNAYNIAVYADRGMEVGETLWQHTIPRNIAIVEGAPLSSGVLSTPASTPLKILVLHRGALIGSFEWATGDIDATIVWNDSVAIFKGDEVIFEVSQSDLTAEDITINLVGVIV